MDRGGGGGGGHVEANGVGAAQGQGLPALAAWGAGPSRICAAGDPGAKAGEGPAAGR